ncbi:MAG: heme-binding domain-containing protein [Thermoleophilia bacterium]|nr:heme-binding domain-containing protein [Thermoleophilia bacterium]
MWKLMRKLIVPVLAGLLVLALAIQIVPYGRSHTNPPLMREPAWRSPQTRQIAVTACYDCHSNETVWPWYSLIAPVSWLVQNDVDRGRETLNFSEWQSGNQSEDDPAEVVREGEMPPWFYTITHPAARLSPSEREALAQELGRN